MSTNNTTRHNAHRTPPERTAPSNNEKVGCQGPNFEPATPSKVFRLKSEATLCFQQLTTIFNRTTFRLKSPPRLAIENSGPAMEDVHNSCDS